MPERVAEAVSGFKSMPRRPPIPCPITQANPLPLFSSRCLCEYFVSPAWHSAPSPSPALTCHSRSTSAGHRHLDLPYVGRPIHYCAVRPAVITAIAYTWLSVVIRYDGGALHMLALCTCHVTRAPRAQGFLYSGDR